MHVLSILSLSSLALAVPAMNERPEPAALLMPRSGNANVIPGRYIVKMKDAAEISRTAKSYKARHTYGSRKFKGFAATLSDAELEEVRKNPHVSNLSFKNVVFEVTVLLFDYR